jgi:4'-phosphopantetheinyl transferase
LERAQFAALPAAARDEASFRLWSRKEAYVKALGEGLSHPLDGFSVGSAAAACFLPAAPAGWSLHHFEPADGYLGALAVDHPAALLLRFAAAPLLMPFGAGK